MTFVLSFPRYAITHLGCHLRQTGLENLYTPYLCIGHMQVNTLDHVYGRCILRWHNLTSRYTLSLAEATPVGLVDQSLEGVPGLPSPSIHSPPMKCLRFRLSIASHVGTLLGYDSGLLLTSEEDSEAAFENYWSPVSHSSVGSACSQVSAQVFFRRGIPAFLSCYHNIIDCMWKRSWKLLLALWSVTSWHISLRLPALPMPWTLEVVSHLNTGLQHSMFSFEGCRPEHIPFPSLLILQINVSSAEETVSFKVKGLFSLQNFPSPFF